MGVEDANFLTLRVESPTTPAKMPPEFTIQLFFERLSSEKIHLTHIAPPGETTPVHIADLCPNGRDGLRDFQKLLIKLSILTLNGSKSAPNSAKEIASAPFATALRKRSTWILNFFRSVEQNDLNQIFDYQTNGSFIRFHRNSKIAVRPFIYLQTDSSGIPIVCSSPSETALQNLLEPSKPNSESTLSLRVSVASQGGQKLVDHATSTHTAPALPRNSLVNIHATHESTQSIAIFWISSNGDTYEIYPDTDSLIGGGKVHHALTPGSDVIRNLVIPEGPGFMIDSTTGTECCILIAWTRNQQNSKESLRTRVATVSKNSKWLRLSHPSPQRFFLKHTPTPKHTPSPKHTQKQKIRLAPPPDLTNEPIHMLEEILHFESSAIMLVMPIRDYF